MLKFIRSRAGVGSSGHHSLSSDRIKDLFSLTRATRHGFPNSPTAAAFDDSLSLLAIATKKSEIRVYGRPGVEYCGQLDESSVVKQIRWIGGKRGQLVLLMEDGIIQLWQLPEHPHHDDDEEEKASAAAGEEEQDKGIDRTIVKVRSIDFFVRGEGSIRQAITVTVTKDGESVLVGTTGGNIHSILLSTFSPSQSPDAILSQDVVLQSAAEQLLANKPPSQGPVEVIAERPLFDKQFLIAYQRGLIVLWNSATGSIDRVYSPGQQVESASWSSNGNDFTTCHNDGRVISWKVSDGAVPSPDASRIPYGPFPCKAVTRVFIKTIRGKENLTILTGGMPRSTYGDKMTVSLIAGDQDRGKHQVLDFTSKVIEVLVIDDPETDPDTGSVFDNPIAVLILLEEEIVAIDVRHDDWLPFKLPLLSSVHSSGITSTAHYSDLADEVYQSIIAAGKLQDEGKYSYRDWPITGGSLPVIPEPTSSREAEVNSEDKIQTPAVTQDEGRASGEANEPQDVIPGVTGASYASAAAASIPTSADQPDSTTTTDTEKKEITADADGTDGACLSHESSAPLDGSATIPASASTVNKWAKTKDILITGHEDGSILIWDASDVSLRHILTINTRKYFLSPDGDIVAIDADGEEGGATTAAETEEAETDEWPPFRKVGTFDPYSDDPRLAIRRLSLCPMSGAFAAAGTAGQVLYFKLTSEASGSGKPIPVHKANLVEETTGFVWKGHDELHVRTTAIKIDIGYEAEFVLQVWPPAAITALSLNSEWHLLSAGTAHGFVVYDLMAGKTLVSKCTLNPADLAATAGGDVLISRRKSFKKSLRESFRRLRRGRGTSTRVKKTTPSAGDSPDKSSDTPANSPIRSIASAGDEDIGGKPVERQIEARQEDGLGSMIRTIAFSPANILTPGSPVPSLWIGTNAGTVLIYTITIPEEEEKRTEGEEEVKVTLAKEIQLKHRAPVILVQVIDSTGYPLPDPLTVTSGKAKAPSTIGHQRVLIVSEEQFKLFSLPNLKPERKSKLTANEGSRAKKVTVAQFHASDKSIAAAAVSATSASLKSPIEHCLTCCSNQGDVSVYSITDLKRVQNHVSVIRREDVHGIASVLLTTRGEGLFLHSPSEFQRFSLSPQKALTAKGWVLIPAGIRPVIVEPVIEPEAVADAVATDEADKGDVDAEKDGLTAALSDVAIKEETEEEIAAVTSASATAAAVAAAVLTSATDDVVPSPVTQEKTETPDSVTKSASELAAAAKETLTDSSVNGAGLLIQDLTKKAADSKVLHSVIDSVPEALIPDLLNNGNSSVAADTVTTIPSLNNGVNGHKKNGHLAVGQEENGDEDEDSSDGHVNGDSGAGNNGTLTPDMSATSSILNADITIDSVRDFTNLTISEDKKPIVSKGTSAFVAVSPSLLSSDLDGESFASSLPAASAEGSSPSSSSASATAAASLIGESLAAAVVSEVGGAADSSSSNTGNSQSPAGRGKGGKNSSSSIPRSNSSRGAGGGRRNKNNASRNSGGGSNNNRQRNSSHRNSQQQQQQQQHQDD